MHLGDVLGSGGILTIDLPKIKDQKSFEYIATYSVM